MITDKKRYFISSNTKNNTTLKSHFYSLNYETSYKNSLTRLYCYTHIVFREKRLALYIYMNNEVIQKVFLSNTAQCAHIYILNTKRNGHKYVGVSFDVEDIYLSSSDLQF